MIGRRPLIALILLSPLVMVWPTYAQSETDAGSPDGSEREADPSDDESLSAAELDELCNRLAAETEADRREATDRIKSAAPSSLAVIRDRLSREQLSAPGDIEALMRKVADRRQPQQLPPRGEDPPLDVLPRLLSLERNEDDERTLREITEVVVLLRALSERGDSSATLTMVRYGPRERGVFMAEIARNTKRIGDRAIPGLLRAARHPDAKVSDFASKLLKWIRRPDHSQQVQVRDPAVLAEILTVYGESGDRDAMPVLLAFSGSEKAIVREAARESAMRFGRAILWPAKIKYENFTGEEPNRSWDWRELTDRLFKAQDQARMAQAEQSMTQGLELAGQGRYPEMIERYEQILGRWPRYERRAEMVPGLVAFAEARVREGDHVGARQLIHQALLLDPEGEAATALRAKILLWEIEADMARGVADPVKLERLAALGYSSPRAEQIAERIRERTETPSPRYYRLVAATGLVLFGLACLGLLIVRALPKGWGAAKAQPAKDDPPASEAAEASGEHEGSDQGGERDASEMSPQIRRGGGGGEENGRNDDQGLSGVTGVSADIGHCDDD